MIMTGYLLKTDLEPILEGNSSAEGVVFGLPLCLTAVTSLLTNSSFCLNYLGSWCSCLFLVRQGNRLDSIK